MAISCIILRYSELLVHNCLVFVKHYDNTLSRFHRIEYRNVTDGETDGRADRFVISISRVSKLMLTRDKNEDWQKVIRALLATLEGALLMYCSHVVRPYALPHSKSFTRWDHFWINSGCYANYSNYANYVVLLCVANAGTSGQRTGVPDVFPREKLSRPWKSC